MEQVDTTTKRSRSPEYPGFSFNECLEFVRIIDTLGNGPVAYNLISSQLGLTSITTRSFTNKISSSKQFGLITTSNKTAELTHEAKLLLYPTGNNIDKLKVDCVKKSNLYNSLIDKFSNKPIPSREVLGNILLNDYKILKTIKDSVADKFIETMHQIGLVVNGVLKSDIEEQDNVQQVDLFDNNILPDTSVIQKKDEDSCKEDDELNSDYREFTVKVDSGKIAKLSIPKDCTDKEIQMIKDMIGLFFKHRFNI